MLGAMSPNTPGLTPIARTASSLVDLGQHRLQAHVARRLLELAQHGTLAVVTGLVLSVAIRRDRVLGVINCDESCDPLLRRVAQP